MNSYERKIRHILFKYAQHLLFSHITFGHLRQESLRKKEHYLNLLGKDENGVSKLHLFSTPVGLQQPNQDYADAYRNLLIHKPELFGIDRYCNICGYRFSKFFQTGVLSLREGRCPVCGSNERQRHLFVHLAALFPFLKNKKILHFAPEPMLKTLFLQSQAEYYDADIVPGKAAYQADITDIPFGDAYFDYVICFHVLEHIPDDLKAMRELHRVLKTNGIAYLCVPLSLNLREDPSVTDPKERERLFGQDDHVRFYNREVFLQRLKKAGFDTSLVSDPSSFPALYNAAKLSDLIVLARKISG